MIPRHPDDHFQYASDDLRLSKWEWVKFGFGVVCVAVVMWLVAFLVAIL